MITALIFGGMLAGMIVALYLWHWAVLRRQKRALELERDDPKSTAMMAAVVASQSRPWAPAVFALFFAAGVGLLLALVALDPGFAIRNYSPEKHIIPAFPDAGSSDEPDNRARVKLIIFEDPDMINPLTMDECPDHMITYVDRRGAVRCDEPTERGYKVQPGGFMDPPDVDASVKTQGLAQVAKGRAPKERKRWVDKFAEIIFFLAIVLGVLGKYYWDYEEARQRGERTEFHPNRIVLALIIAMLVYYSVQQGLEGDGGRFSFRGFLFAFMNGFTFQGLIRPGGILARRNGRPKEATNGNQS
jgi:hypothetical protein